MHTKVWKKACKAAGLEGRIVHDLRRSGVKHLIGAGIDPHTAMAFSGHRTESMLLRHCQRSAPQAAAQYLTDYAWRIGDVAVRALADHAPINYVWAVP